MTSMNMDKEEHLEEEQVYLTKIYLKKSTNPE
jgi:hypothetical protein